MRRARLLLFVVIIALAAWGLWGAFRKGPAASITLDTERPAVGRGSMQVSAHFEESELGLASIELEVQQGERVEVIASESFETLSPFSPLDEALTTSATLEATVGSEALSWLEEGDLVIRARALGPSGPFAESKTLDEVTLPVMLRAPQVQVLSSQHYVRQGGSGAVLLLTDERAEISGVRAGSAEFLSYPKSESNPLERVCLFGIPFDLSNQNEIKVFAEDLAGNRSEASFVDIFKPKPPSRDTIRLPDSFLERVVPAVVSQTPELSGEGSLLDQYLEINGRLRAENRAFIKELGEASKPERLFGGAFVPLPNARRMAGFADTRSYLYEGREVDIQTHLGLDFASIKRAEVPAAATGIVTHTGYVGIYGNVVIIDHGLGLTTVYAHLTSISTQPGQSVNAGDIIGRTGATGLAGGDHLHFGVFVRGVAVDPIEWLDGSWIRNRIDSKFEVIP